MLVWIFQTGEPTAVDGAGFPAMRSQNLAEYLVAEGHEVVLWTSTFFHQAKLHRELGSRNAEIDGYKIRFIDSPGYSKNIGLSRILDHVWFAFSLGFSISRQGERPDVIFAGYPPIEVGVVAALFGKRVAVPVVVDVKDLWPHMFLDIVPVWARSLTRLLFAPYFWCCKFTIYSASAISAPSDSYLDWSLGVARRPKTQFDLVTPLSRKVISINAKKRVELDSWWLEQGVDLSHKNRFCFVGSFMSVFDFEPILEAAKIFKEGRGNCQFVVCGTGDTFDDVKSMFEGCENVVFPGWISREQHAVLAESCSGSFIPYKNIENFRYNIPNKVVDSLSFGLPIITCLTGAVQNLIERYNVGYVCSPNDPSEFVCRLQELMDNPEVFRSMSKNCRTLFLERFEPDAVYLKLVKNLQALVATRN